MVKIRILEQENERQLRKIRALEQQLSELEQLHGARVQVKWLRILRANFD